MLLLQCKVVHNYPSVVYSHVLFVELTEYDEVVIEIVKLSKGWNYANDNSNFTSFGCGYV